ncbi:MAG: MFS transporter [Bacillota bacterium]
MTKKKTIWTWNFILLCVITIFLYSTFKMLVPVIPKYADFLGYDKGVIGTIIAPIAFMGIIARPVTGWLSDLYGRKKLFIGTVVIYLFAMIILLFAKSAVMLFIMAIIMGIGFTASNGITNVMAVDIVGPERKGEGLGLVSIFSTATLFYSPLLSLTISEKYGYNHVFILALVLVGLGLLFTCLIRSKSTLRNENVKEGSEVREKTSIVGDVIKDGNMKKAFILMLLMALPYSGIQSFLPLHAAEQGIQNIGTWYTVYAVVFMIVRTLAGRIYDLKGPNIIVTTSFFFTIISYFILAKSTSLWFYYVAAILYGYGIGGLHISFCAIAIEKIKVEARGLALTTIMGAYDFGLGFGGIIAGYVAQFTSYSSMYMYSIVASLIGLLLFIKWMGSLEGKWQSKTGSISA